ncbi:chemotaxis protein CheW [uncultured Methylobacterium sp.]|jgi:purine-binding chemotaxis protein CheW|uniref:chemotaxis protein CheW n=1 Tax=uncultured Methylobacterium sp. TaxID=157278 RepID=UPI00262B2454|nr:chemotaxis protein CheW [uncultured Methylobacterium sp.]
MAEASGAGRYLLCDGRPGRFALPAAAVIEVLRPPPLTRLPGAAPALAGLANRRGAALPVLDWRHPDRARDPAPARVVVVQAGEPVGLSVDAVAGLVAADGLDAPGPGDGPAAIGRLPGAPVLDPGRLVAGAVPPALRPAGPIAAPAPPVPPRAGPGRAAPLLAVRVAGRPYAVPLARVAGLLARPAGAAVWRGRPLPVVSLAALLGVEAPDSGRRLVVAGGVGLAVDGVGPVLRPEPADLDPVPRGLGAAAAAFAAILRSPQDGSLVPVLALERLLDGTAAPPEPAGAPAAPAARFLAVDLAGTLYGLPVTAIREVLRLPAVAARLPHAPGFVAGLVQHDGAALPLIDWRRRLGHPPSRPTARRRLVVVDHDGRRAGLIVDGAARLHALDSGRIRPAPDRAGGPADRVGLLDDGDRLLLVDPAAFLDGLARELAPAGRMAEAAA